MAYHMPTITPEEESMSVEVGRLYDGRDEPWWKHGRSMIRYGQAYQSVRLVSVNWVTGLCTVRATWGACPFLTIPVSDFRRDFAFVEDAEQWKF